MTSTTPKAYNFIPDAMLFSCVGGAIIITYLFDSPVVVPQPFNQFGWVFIVLGSVIVFRLLALLKAKHTSTNPIDTPSRLLTTGLFAWSRNPLYAAYVLIVLGAAIVLGELLAFVAPLVCWAVIHTMVIPIEEQKLGTTFGQAYEKYKKSTPRWI